MLGMGKDWSEESSIKTCNCRPACTRIRYESHLVTTMNQLPHDNVSQEVRITMFFKHSSFIPIKRSELFDQTAFIANCGGIMGLFLGISMISLVEICYFCTLKPLCVFLQAHKNRKNEKRTVRRKRRVWVVEPYRFKKQAGFY